MELSAIVLPASSTMHHLTCTPPPPPTLSLNHHHDVEQARPDIRTGSPARYRALSEPTLRRNDFGLPAGQPLQASTRSHRQEARRDQRRLSRQRTWRSPPRPTTAPLPPYGLGRSTSYASRRSNAASLNSRMFAEISADSVRPNFAAVACSACNQSANEYIQVMNARTSAVARDRERGFGGGHQWRNDVTHPHQRAYERCRQRSCTASTCQIRVSACPAQGSTEDNRVTPCRYTAVGQRAFSGRGLDHEYVRTRRVDHRGCRRRTGIRRAEMPGEGVPLNFQPVLPGRNMRTAHRDTYVVTVALGPVLRAVPVVQVPILIRLPPHGAMGGEPKGDQASPVPHVGRVGDRKPASIRQLICGSGVPPVSMISSESDCERSSADRRAASPIL